MLFMCRNVELSVLFKTFDLTLKELLMALCLEQWLDHKKARLERGPWGTEPASSGAGCVEERSRAGFGPVVAVDCHGESFDRFDVELIDLG